MGILKIYSLKEIALKNYVQLELINKYYFGILEQVKPQHSKH
jgi:hypothetical protein